MNHPTLPGTLPGLLRRGAPVWYRDEETPWVVAVVLPDGRVVIAPCDAVLCIGLTVVLGDLALDLSDSVGRDIAVRWASDLEHERNPDEGPYFEENLERWVAMRDRSGALRDACLALAERSAK